MGIYDRDYYRQGGSGFRLTAPRSAVVAIILLNIAVYVVEIVGGETFGHRSLVADFLSPHVNYDAWQDHPLAPTLAWWQHDTLSRPWLWWQLLTCGFVHEPFPDWTHLAGNMLVLFFLGRDVETWYGTREFVRLYLAMLVFSAVVWAVASRLFDSHASNLIGASGAISGVVVLYALNFPKRILLLMFVLPVPAWLLGAMMIAFDIVGAMQRSGNVAYTAHLGGTAFALAYFHFRWNLGQIIDSAAIWLKGRSRPSLKVFKPENEADAPVADEEVDRILAKIHREGENSLTRKERRILESASREYQRRRRPE